jgi:hypothetical protein
VNVCDVGGFTPLILCAFHGNLRCAVYLLKHGADLLAQGRLRSGQYLTAEHWAAVQNNQELFAFLRATRLRRETKGDRDNATGGAITAPVEPTNSSELSVLDINTTVSRTPSSFHTSVDPAKIGGSSGDSSGGGSFCICGRGFDGSMVACDAPGCAVEWFHFECVGLAGEVRDFSSPCCFCSS